MREYHVLNLGAGVQSTCLFLLAREPDADLHFDVAIFADTQEEPRAVYDHLNWLRSLGDPPVWVRTTGKLGDDLMHGRNSTGQRFVSIPCFTAEDHEARLHCGNSPQPAPKHGILRRQCTKEYKIEVVERAIRRELVGLKPTTKTSTKGWRRFLHCRRGSGTAASAATKSDCSWACIVRPP